MQLTSSSKLIKVNKNITTPLKEKYIAIVGNPNTGKSTIFNFLTASKQKTSNYPGVTVEKKTSSVRWGKTKIHFVDLPGCYSLQSTSRDEKIPLEYLKGDLPGEKAPDLILFILDATNLKRNLYLFSQIVELNLPVVVALTMTDLLSKNGVKLNIDLLQKKLFYDIIPVTANVKQSMKDFKIRLQKILNKENKKSTSFIPQFGSSSADSSETSSNELANKAKIPQLRYQWAQKVVESVEKRMIKDQSSTLEKLDIFLKNRFSGFIVFFIMMYLLFQTVYTFSEPIMESIENGFSFLRNYSNQFLDFNPVLNSFVQDGVISGVGSVMIFIPQIVLLFILVSILEDSGYLSRAAFLMDKLFAWTGLNGRSFIPLLSCFACAVPGIMSTRVIPDYKTRLITILIAPLISCSARLPVYILLIGTFIQPVWGAGWAAFVFFAMHSIGLLIAFPIAWIFNKSLLQKEYPTFFLEMPPYRRPYLKNVFYKGFEAGKKFVIKGGKIIFIFSVIVWFFTYFPRPQEVAIEQHKIYEQKINEISSTTNPQTIKSKIDKLEKKREKDIAQAYLEQSYLGRVGKWMHPIFAPLGYDWKITLGILSAFPARELIISTLGVLYSVGDDTEQHSGLRDKLKNAKKEDGSPVYDLLTVMSLMVFFALCCQCMSTLAVIRRELNSWGWAVFTFFYMTLIAYFSAWGIYQLGSYFI